MRTPWLSIAFVSLLTMSTGFAFATAARATESVGNMKRIVIPEKGPPQTTIAPSGSSGNASSSKTTKSPANPTSGAVNVPSMIQGGLKNGGPLPLR